MIKSEERQTSTHTLVTLSFYHTPRTPHTCPVLLYCSPFNCHASPSGQLVKQLSLVVTPSSLVYDTHGLLALLCSRTICNMSHNGSHPSADSLAFVAHPHTCVFSITPSLLNFTLHIVCCCLYLGSHTLLVVQSPTHPLRQQQTLSFS